MSVNAAFPDGTDNNAGDQGSNQPNDVPEFDFSGFEDEPQIEPETPVETTNSGAENDEHDFYKNIFKPEYNIPEPIQNVMRPALDDYSKGVSRKIQSIHEQYSTLKQFQPFVEQNVPLEDLNNAYFIFNKMRQDPESFFKELADVVGYELSEEEEEALIEELVEETGSPMQIQLQQALQAQEELREQLEQQQQFLMLREQEQQNRIATERESAAIQQDLQQVADRYNGGKPLPQKVVQELAQRILFKQSQGKQSSFVEEMQALVEYQNRLRGSSAPRPLSGTGTAPGSSVPKENDSFDARVDFVRRFNSN